jgi:hypothetical protein
MGSVQLNTNESVRKALIIGVCILSHMYQLNIRTPPYMTNVSALIFVAYGGVLIFNRKALIEEH